MESVQSMEPLESVKNKNFYHSVAFANAGATTMIVTNKTKEQIFPLIVFFNEITLNDIIIYLHLYDYTHSQYIDIMRTLLLNPPIDVSTYIIKGETLKNDITIYNEETLDIVIIDFLRNSFDVIEYVVLIWNKLKCNGTLIFTDVDGNDQNLKNELLKLFGTVIKIPPTICVDIHFIIDTNILMIKKTLLLKHL